MNRWHAMSVALVAGFVTLLDVSIVNVALPSIRADLQTGQRIGTALGIAAVGAVFFNRLAAGGDWDMAFRVSLTVTIGFVLAALVAAGTDVLAARRADA